MKKSLLVLSLVFLFSVVGCTPQIVINTGDENKNSSTSSTTVEEFSAENGTADASPALDSAPQTTVSKVTVIESSSSPSQTSGGSQTTASFSSAQITKDYAKSVAFGHAGVNEADVYDLEAELDRDDGVVSWEIEFKSGKTEYKYDIKASDGTILESEKDFDD